MITKELSGCVIHDSAGRVLLIHRNTERLTQWELPGGKVEPGETIEQAAQREALEEIGVQVRVLSKAGETEFEDNGVHWRYHWCRAKIITGLPGPCEPAIHDAVGYFDLCDPNIEAAGISINVVALVAAIKNNQLRH